MTIWGPEEGDAPGFEGPCESPGGTAWGPCEIGLLTWTDPDVPPDTQWGYYTSAFVTTTPYAFLHFEAFKTSELVVSGFSVSGEGFNQFGDAFIPGAGLNTFEIRDILIQHDQYNDRFASAIAVADFEIKTILKQHSQYGDAFGTNHVAVFGFEIDTILIRHDQQNTDRFLSQMAMTDFEISIV